MTHTLYPNPPVRAQRLGRAPSARQDIEIRQLAGPPTPEFAGDFAQMMFIEVAGLSGGVPPQFSLKAGTGARVQLGAQKQAIFRTTGQTEFVGVAWLVTLPENIWQIMVGFATASTERWSLGIANNDNTSDQDYTWVVADNAADAKQPWNNTARASHPSAYHIASTIPYNGPPDAVSRDLRLAFDDGTGTLYKASTFDDRLDAIVGGVVTSRVALGDEPLAIAVDTNTHTVFASYSTHIGETGRFSAVKDNAAITKSLPKGPFGETGVRVDSSRRLGYFYNELQSAPSPVDGSEVPIAVGVVTIVDLDTKNVRASISAGGNSRELAVDQHSGAVYVLDFHNSRVSAIRAQTLQETYTVAPQSVLLAMVQPGGAIYACSFRTLSIIDPSTRTVTPVEWADLLPTSQGFPEAISVDPDSCTAYVVTLGPNPTGHGASPRIMWAIDIRTTRPVASLDLGRTTCRSIAIDHGNRTLYLDGGDGTIKVVKPVP